MNTDTLISTLIARNVTEPVVAPSHLREALSSISSSTSLACWIVLLLPQLIEQWKLKSSEGLSIGFVIIWFVGDLANLLGSLWAGLLPGVVMLAIWYCIADGLLISSYLYYKNRGPNSNEILEQPKPNVLEAGSSQNDATQPLLRRNSSSRRKSSAARRRRDSLSSIVAAPSSPNNVLTQYILPVLFVIGAGVVGYLFSSSPDHDEPSGGDTQKIGTGPQILGYISAILYLGARLPQIYQNHSKRSVYGLSLLFFMFSMMGNFTYAGGILFYRSDAQYVMLYLPWLLGSLGTVFEDVIIMLQFYIYNREKDIKNSSAILE